MFRFLAKMVRPLFVLTAVSLAIAASAAPAIRVACVGDSITFGWPHEPAAVCISGLAWTLARTGV